MREQDESTLTFKCFEIEASPSLLLEIWQGQITDVLGDEVVSSSNNWLIAGSSSAGQLKKVGGVYSPEVTEQIFKKCLDDHVFARLPFYLEHMFDDHNLVYKLQWQFVQAIISNGASDSKTGLAQPLTLGSIVRTSSYDHGLKSGFPKTILNLVTTEYETQMNQGRIVNLKLKPFAMDQVAKSILNLLKYSLDQLHDQVLILPQIGLRHSQLSFEQSVQMIIQIILQYVAETTQDDSQRVIRLVFHPKHNVEVVRQMFKSQAAKVDE